MMGREEMNGLEKLFIIALHLAYGGVEKAISEFANMMAERYEVHILSVYKMPNAPAYPIDSRVSITYLLDDIPNRQEFHDAVSRKDPVGILREGMRAVRILHDKRTCVIRAIRGISNGIIVTTRDEHNILLSKYARKGVVRIAQLHQDYVTVKHYNRHFRSCYEGIDVFSLLSPKMVREVREIMRENRHTKVVYVPNFMEKMPEAPALAPREKKVIAVGRLDRVKGFDRLIRIFAAMHREAPEWTLDIVGSGEEEQALRKTVAENRADDFVHLTGRYTPEQVSAAMQQASIYAMSSYTEGFPYVLLEAMSCALPIVAIETRSGLEMLVKDSENGFLVPDEKAFSEALEKLMKDEELRMEMAQRSLSFSRQFTREEVAKTWFQLIGEVADGRG